MTCTVCGHEGLASEFTKTGLSKDKTRAVCKKCRRAQEVQRRAKKRKEAEALPYFELLPSLITTHKKARIGVMVMTEWAGRESGQSVGLSAILGELREPWEYCPPAFINQYAYVLVSLTSVTDIETLIFNMEVNAPKEKNCVIIAGGFGVVNINLIIPYIDVAVFGRAEGQINEIITGHSPANVWRKADDPCWEQQYTLRQPRYLVKGERSVGCHNKCHFCQYTHTRRSIGDAARYDPGMRIQETDWHGLEVAEAGRYTTAWDGWSDDTRRKVNKPVTDSSIIDKLITIGNAGIEGTVMMKVFQIVGYPWETMASVREDIRRTGELLREIDRAISGRITITFLLTPFGPEPLTPMENDPANIDADWRELNNLRVCNGDNLKATILPFTTGPYTLLKRMMINRARYGDTETFKRVAYSKELLQMPDALRVPWLMKYGHIDKGKLQGSKIPLTVEERGGKQAEMMFKETTPQD